MLKKKWLILISFVVIAALAAAALVGEGVYNYFFPYLDQQISGPITLSSQWTELVPSKPLSVHRQIQILVLDLDKTIRFQRDGFELVLPDGSTVTPRACGF